MYKIVRGFLSIETAEDMALMLKNQIHGKNGDEQVPKSHSIGNFSALNILLGSLTSKVSEITGKELLPTYSYARIYLRGAELKVHKDRPSCEYSVTVNLSQTHQWPIYMGDEKILLNPGDGVVYKGCDIEHSRKVFDGDEYTQVFFHYVDANGPYRDHVFDKQRMMMNPFKPEYVIRFDRPPHNQVNYYKFSNFISDFVIDKLIERLSKEELHEARVGDGPDGEIVVNTRRARVFWIPKTEEFLELYKTLAEGIQECNGNFYHFKLTEIAEQIQYTVYNEEYLGHYDWHIDMGPGQTKENRKLSLVLQLSNPSEYEGGELQIKTGYGELTAPKEKGTLILFPSYLLHRVTPVTKGTRRSLVLWITGPPFV